jgi:hypothetical protein
MIKTKSNEEGVWADTELLTYSINVVDGAPKIVFVRGVITFSLVWRESKLYLEINSRAQRKLVMNGLLIKPYMLSVYSKGGKLVTRNHFLEKPNYWESDAEGQHT